MRVASVFGDGMVLQRGMPVPVWGWGNPGETVAVSVAGKSAQATVGDDGKWMAVLPELPVGGPYAMTVSGAATITFSDVLVGDVWVCSGQSNMEWPTSLTMNAEEEVAAANHPRIRLFTVPKKDAIEPQDTVEAEWLVCTPETIPNFSAVGYFFGRALQQALDVPVGLINTSWGGTVAEAWTSREALLGESSLRQMISRMDAALEDPEKAQQDYEAAMRAWETRGVPQDPGDAGFAQGWADPAFDASAWETMELPSTWQSAGLSFSGALWFRRTVEIPAAWAGRALTLHVGACDKNDMTYFNNTFMGSYTMQQDLLAWSKPRVYPIPAELVKTGENLVAVRVFSHMYAGGMTGPACEMYIAPADDPTSRISLAGAWQYNIELNFGLVQPPPPPTPPPGKGDPNVPTVLYNAMIAPLVPYGICGAIWYQGESNAGRPYEYRTLFPTMIRCWRRAWGQGNFAFYFVQLANYMAERAEPDESLWAELREAQTLTLREPHTGMAVIIDIGEAEDIHPRNKQDVGKRLAASALAQTFGKDVPSSGPLYTGAQVEGNAMRLFFAHTDCGLVARDGLLTGFAIAGANHKFVWADAVIDGETVVVSSPQVPDPVAVRYAWADNPRCNLYNGAGFPASPFRTDQWGVPEEMKLAETVKA